ncbi:MAG: T9SS type A sorting domain-containing protein [Saprospiraceae bacterium]
MSIHFSLRYLFISFLLKTSIIFGQTSNPDLPNVKDVITCFPDTSNYKRITVGPIGRDYSDLQSALNAANLGSIIILDAGQSFNGGFVLPAKNLGNGWIILMSSRMDLLSKEEQRIDITKKTNDLNFPTQRAAMPKIVTTNLSGIPCFVTQANSHHYRLVGLEITVDEKVLQSYGIVNLGDGSANQNSLNTVPNHFIVDRCFIHGHSAGDIMKYGIRLDCSNAAVIDCNISDFHSIGFDAQAISGINGPGPFVILNNYLEASGENILFGGGQAAIKGLVPSDILIRQNYFYKPYTWRMGHPSYLGKHWTIKNLFELKTGKRVLFDANVLENCWADLPTGQSGYAILLTVRTEGGGSPQADVSDVTISNNIVKNCGAGITLAGSDDGVGNISKRIRIYNNLFENINGSMFGDNNINGPNDGTFIKVGEPENLQIDHNTLFQSGAITWAYKIMKSFSFTNNLCLSMPQQAGYQGIYGPGYARGNATIMHYFPDLLDQDKKFNKNILIGDDSLKYNAYKVFSVNYFVQAISQIGFINYSKGVQDYHNYGLMSSSKYYRFGSDKEDIGVNFTKMDSAFNSERCSSISTNLHEAKQGEMSIQLFPNPTKDFIHILATNNALDSKFKIMDILGREMYSGHLVDSNLILSLTNFNPGIYLFSCKGNIIKFIVEKN